jgi:hypothetical protein
LGGFFIGITLGFGFIFWLKLKSQALTQSLDHLWWRLDQFNQDTLTADWKLFVAFGV